MNVAEGTTVIGKSVKIVGEVSGTEDLLVEGELHGTIHLPGARVTIGAPAKVRADIVAQDVIIHGKLEGDVRAKGRVELRSSAMVQGGIYAGTLSIEENAAFRGQVDPSRAQEPLPVAPIASAVPLTTVPVPQRPVVPAQPISGYSSTLPAALAVAASRPVITSAPETPDAEPAKLFEETEA